MKFKNHFTPRLCFDSHYLEIISGIIQISSGTIFYVSGSISMRRNYVTWSTSHISERKRDMDKEIKCLIRTTSFAEPCHCNLFDRARHICRRNTDTDMEDLYPVRALSFWEPRHLDSFVRARRMSTVGERDMGTCRSL